MCHRSGKIGRRLLRLHRGGQARVLGEGPQGGRGQHRDGVIVFRGADARGRHQGGRHLRVPDGPAQERPSAGAQGGARGVAGAAPEVGGALHQELPGAEGPALARRPLRLDARAQPAPLQARPARVRDVRLNCSRFHKFTMKETPKRSTFLIQMALEANNAQICSPASGQGISPVARSCFTNVKISLIFERAGVFSVTLQ